MRVFIDADVLIWHLRGRQEARECLSRLLRSPECELWTGAWQKVEVSFHTTREELPLVDSLLRLLRIAPIDSDTVDEAARIFREWSPSHGIEEGDALLAAQVIRAHGKLVTLNTRHFPMPEIAVQRAWPVHAGDGAQGAGSST